MLKISWNYMFNRSEGNGGSIWNFIFPVFYIPILISNIIDESDNGDWKIMLIIIAIAIFAIIGGMSAKLPESIFLMPVSRKQREEHIKKFFWMKLAICAGGCVCIPVIGVVLGIMNPTAAVLIALDCITFAYLLTQGDYYSKKNDMAEVVYVVGIVAFAILLVATAGFAGDGAMSVAMKVLGIISAIFYVIMWFNCGKKVDDMCKSLADYEKLVITNMPLEKRAKMQEQGLL